MLCVHKGTGGIYVKSNNRIWICRTKTTHYTLRRLGLRRLGKYLSEHRLNDMVQSGRLRRYILLGNDTWSRFSSDENQLGIDPMLESVFFVGERLYLGIG